jgi:type IV fimbrial biogenesis protein FimT
MDRRSKIQGFTLLELMVVIAIAGVLMAMALPSFQNTLRSNRLATTTNQLNAAIALARSEAIKSTQAAGLCPSADGTTCGADWNAGWLIWRDVNRDGTLANDATEPVLQYFANTNKIALTATGATKFSFDARGAVTARDASNAALSSIPTITLKPVPCPTGQQLVNQLGLLKTGQISTTKAACS